MTFMGKDLKDLVVTLPFADGTELDCGVFASFEVDEKNYLVLLPMAEDGKLDFSQSYMLYRVEEDEDQNPAVVYIEDDMEYEVAAKYFSDNYLNK